MTHIIRPNLEGRALRIGIVQSRFNPEVCAGLLSACLAELDRRGVSENDITLATVPGALEIPVVLGAMATSRKYDGLIALGAIIRGETYHFEVVSNESARGIGQISVLYDLPVANAVLTTENDAQAVARMYVKGAEAAQVVIEMIHLLNDPNL
jgi:6,7-dimethyl-8-ribityllumazine synthase